MLLIICVERLLHIGSHFSLRKWQRRLHFWIFLQNNCQNWQRWPHFPTKLAAAASFSYQISGGGKDLATLLALSWHGLDIGLTVFVLQISAVFRLVILAPVALFHWGHHDKNWWRHSMNCGSIKNMFDSSKCSQKSSAATGKKLEQYNKFNNLFGS